MVGRERERERERKGLSVRGSGKECQGLNGGKGVGEGRRSV